jgi:hypothetical protein
LWRFQGLAGAFDQAAGEPEFATQCKLAGGHFAIVRFVIEAREVQQAVKHQNFQFGCERVIEDQRLARRHVDGNG